MVQYLFDLLRAVSRDELLTTKGKQKYFIVSKRLLCYTKKPSIR
jgi:hypothetical protein